MVFETKEKAYNMKYEVYEFSVVTAPTNGNKRYFNIDFTCLCAPDLYVAT
jgi:hypothetical protein